MKTKKAKNSAAKSAAAPAVADAIHLHRWEFVGTSEIEWDCGTLEAGEHRVPAMQHVPTGATFIIGGEEAVSEDVMPRYAVLVLDGALDPRDRTAIAYLGRAAVWFYLWQIPEIRALFEAQRAEQTHSGHWN